MPSNLNNNACPSPGRQLNPSKRGLSSALLALLLLIFCPIAAISEPLSKTFKIERKQFNQGYCNVDVAELEIRLSESFGEPIVASQFKWFAGPNTSADCLPEQLDLWVEWKNQDDQIGFMPVSVKASTSGIMSDERLSSPGWSGVLCQTRTFPPRCFNPESAKQFLSKSDFPQRFHLAELVLGREMPGGAQQAQAKQASKPARKLNLNDQFESRLNQSIDSLLSNDSAPKKSDNGRTSTNARSNAGVEGVVNLINQQLGSFERVATLCQGDVRATYTATRLHECGLSVQTEIDLSACESAVERAIRRHRVELDFSERPVSAFSIQDDLGYSTLAMTLKDPLVLGGDQAINLFVLSAEGSKRDTLIELEKSVDTLQALCALGKD